MVWLCSIAKYEDSRGIVTTLSEVCLHKAVGAGGNFAEVEQDVSTLPQNLQAHEECPDHKRLCGGRCELYIKNYSSIVCRKSLRK